MTLEQRYKSAIDKIGMRNLAALPEEIKMPLKKTTNLSDKVKLLEAILQSLQKQGLV